jgi:hypothetical protein
MDALINRSIENAKQNADKNSAWYRIAFPADQAPLLSESLSATPEINLSRFDTIIVLSEFGWKIEHFLRLKFDLWFDDTIIFTLNTFYVRRSAEIDFVADSLWSASETAECVDKWLQNPEVRFIFLPIHYPTGHFALATLDCRQKKCLYFDSASGAFTLAKRNKVDKLLNSWHVKFPFEQVNVRTQKNAVDCGLHVVSYIYSAIKTNGKIFDDLLERSLLFELVLNSIPAHAKTQIEATVEKFQKTELQVLLCTTSKDELRSICVQKGIQCTQEYYNELCDKFKIERKSMSRMEQLLASIADIHTKYGQLCTDEFLNK